MNIDVYDWSGRRGAAVSRGAREVSDGRRVQKESVRVSTYYRPYDCYVRHQLQSIVGSRGERQQCIVGSSRVLKLDEGRNALWEGQAWI